MPRALPIPAPVLRRLDAAASSLLEPDGLVLPDLLSPRGEPGLFAPGSVAWRVFRNPVALLVGGVAAVLMELAHPAVRAGVWTHSRFRSDPVERIRRTGHAAMLTVYAPRSVALPAIERVVRRHGTVRGVTEDGRPYRASDPALLAWVHATAVLGFTTAHDRYVAPLGEGELSRAFAEAVPAARLHGVAHPPGDLAAWSALLERTMPELGPSPVIGEFLSIMRGARLLPTPLGAIRPLALRGAASLVPAPLRSTLGLRGLRPGEGALLRRIGALAARVPLPSHPAAQAELRMLGAPGQAREVTNRGACSPSG